MLTYLLRKNKNQCLITRTNCYCKMSLVKTPLLKQMSNTTSKKQSICVVQSSTLRLIRSRLGNNFTTQITISLSLLHTVNCSKEQQDCITKGVQYCNVLQFRNVDSSMIVSTTVVKLFERARVSYTLNVNKCLLSCVLS